MTKYFIIIVACFIASMNVNGAPPTTKKISVQQAHQQLYSNFGNTSKVLLKGTDQVFGAWDCCQYAFTSSSVDLTGCDGSTYTYYASGMGHYCASDCETAYSIASDLAVQNLISNVIGEMLDPMQGPPCN